MTALIIILTCQMAIVVGLILTALFVGAHDESVAADRRVREAEQRARLARRPAAFAQPHPGTGPMRLPHRGLHAA